MLKDSGGFGAKYGPGTATAQRPDGQWVRVFFDRPISLGRARKFGRAISAGERVPMSRVRIVECDPPYQVPDRWREVDWHSISGAPVGELPSGSRETYLVKYGDTVTHGTYRESWLGEWKWFDERGRRIEPELFAVLAPLRQA